ncbi:acyl-CoA dehydrogenase/oxidase [Apodospora peruviana]|uniref:Acyl-CoA dehydrogenase/oxidase n=1 Tax=Apodospora peruviana TaxID=516989 RepID=A0AAE0MC76_9PEZI|nr:acyl-CoA dehydrogenase/oxidase [Apodospora peruviana]
MNSGIVAMEPSSASTGFFQQMPVLENQFYDDVSLQRIAKLFLPSPLLDQVQPEIAQLGQDVLSQQVLDWITDAERNQPYLRGNGRDAFGRPKSQLVVTEGWRELQKFGFEKGFVAHNYEHPNREILGPYSRLVQFIRCHLWEASCASTLCPAAMQDGAARLLQRHLLTGDNMSPTQRRVLQNAYNHLTSRDPAKAWTSGQWMTERTGGSDVSQTETVAVYDPYPTSRSAPLACQEENIPLGPWSISGFKWFSSATDSQMTILLAKTGPGKGLSAFMAPMRRYIPSSSPSGETELNGVTIIRLKQKFGTQPLPTAELELNNMRGWLIGEESKGIQEISTILNITRVHTTVSSLGYLGRGLAVAKAFCLVRGIGAGKGKRIPLYRNPLHIRTLANLTVDYHAMMLLTFYTLFVLGLDESFAERGGGPLRSPPKRLVQPLLRVLSSLHKAYVCEHTVPAVFACMEALGGVGYLINAESEHINLARIFRDACVGAIWEGTTDVLSSDTLRVLKHPVAGRESIDALDWFINDTLQTGDIEAKIREEWKLVKERLVGENQEDLLPEARQLTFRVAEILMAVLFVVDARANPGRDVEAMCRSYLGKKGFVVVGTEEKRGLDLDLAIVYGRDKGLQLVGNKSKL